MFCLAMQLHSPLHLQKPGGLRGYLNGRKKARRSSAISNATGAANRHDFFLCGRSPLRDSAIVVETDAFEHGEVKPHFINPCCFGEDFAAWLKLELSKRLASGCEVSDIIQEDYGWGFWIRSDHPYWIALSYIGDGPQEEPAQWAISCTCDFGLNVVKRLFAKPDTTELAEIRGKIRNILELNRALTIVDR
jgi:hypothetical protein